MKIINVLQSNPSLFLTSVIVTACCLFSIVLVIILFKVWCERKSAKSAIELNKITNNIRAGLVQFMLGDTCSIEYASKGFYELLGYSKNEDRIENSSGLLDFVYSKDRDFFVKKMNNRENESINSEVRLVKKDGFVIYCLMNGNYAIAKDGKQTVSAVFVDITEQKKMQEMLRMDRERYRIAAELSNDVLFEYFVDTDTMVYSERYKNIFGKDPVINNFVKDCFKRNDYVHPDDYGLFLDFCSKLAEGKNFVSAEIRIKGYLNDYIWCQIMGKTIYDEERKPIRVVGKIVNVDYQKRELDALEYKATRDPLTGVYNREVTIKKIEKYINGNRYGKHALLFIDLDDFKKVNDTYGHLLGDKVLTYIIGKIKSVFAEGEIIGRIGGDEFVVFTGYIESDEEIIRKVNTIIDVLNTTYVDDKCTISISGSIGIALYPDDGTHYEQLLQCADKALYCVKNKGKNNFMFYNAIT